MAHELNGGTRARGGRRQLRVAFVPGTGPDAGRTPAQVVEVGPNGEIAFGGERETALLTDVVPPRARLVFGPRGGANQTHDIIIIPSSDLARRAAGIRRLEVVVDGWRFEIDVDSEARARLRERATSARVSGASGVPSEVRAIIPGRVVSVDVAEGDAVETGGRLLVLEAMKMQNEVKAARAGRVARVAVGPGETVELGDVLLVIE